MSPHWQGTVSGVIGCVIGLVIFGSFVAPNLPKPQQQKPVRLYIQDWTTGCEYIQNPNGGITPRIDSDLMHKGCKSLQDGGEQ